MSQENNVDQKRSAHATPVTDVSVSLWHKYHFSGKVIMCSVLFGFGLVLIGGLVFAIGADKHDEENNGNLSEVQNKAPMSIVGPVIMGLGSFTVIVGVIMCLFETNICRKRQADSKPLIDEQNPGATSRNNGASSAPSTSQKREKHRYHKKPSSRKHKALKRGEHNASPSSMPIDMQRSLPKDLTASDRFVTPSSSLVYDHPKLKQTYSDAENQTSDSLMKSFTSSGKSWNTVEFQTPASSFQESSGSFDGRDRTSSVSPDSEEVNDRLKNLKHEFVTPMNSNAEVLDDKSSENTAFESSQEHTDDDKSSDELTEEISEKVHALNHDFVTPMNSYVEQPNLNSQKKNLSLK